MHLVRPEPPQLERAVVPRRDPELVLIARTDANAVTGFDDALDRGQAYREAGADVVFIEAPASIEEAATIGHAFGGTPLLYNWVEPGKSPMLSLDDIHRLGFRLVIFPVSLLFAATHAMLDVLDRFRRGETSAPAAERMVTFRQFTTLIGLPAIQALEQRYGPVG